MDTGLVGKRCRMCSLAIDHITGAPMRGLTGTIRHRVERLGREFILVDWDGNAEATYVLPADVDLLEEEG